MFGAGIADVSGIANIVDIADVADIAMDIAMDIADMAMNIADIVNVTDYGTLLKHYPVLSCITV